MKQLLTAAEVADLLVVRPSWVYAEARAGRLPSVQLGRYVRFDADEVADWLAAKTQRRGKP